MDYEQFITEIQKYWDLRKKGLKKQANSFLFSFTKSFKENVPDADAILFQFCREYLDEMKFPGDVLPRRHLPFQLTKLLDDYLSRECEKNQMPQMRWAYQIFGNVYNPHDPKLEHDFYPILERAYMHEKCDPQTVQLYFREQLDSLWWGAASFSGEHLHYKRGISFGSSMESSVTPEDIADKEKYVFLRDLGLIKEDEGVDRLTIAGSLFVGKETAINRSLPQAEGI